MEVVLSDTEPGIPAAVGRQARAFPTPPGKLSASPSAV